MVLRWGQLHLHHCKDTVTRPLCFLWNSTLVNFEAYVASAVDGHTPEFVHAWPYPYRFVNAPYTVMVDPHRCFHLIYLIKKLSPRLRGCSQAVLKCQLRRIILI